MAPPSSQIQLSPSELSYIHTSLSQTPPLRPDGRAPRRFRPLVAETDVSPSTNGSARICFADGTEAVVGVKCEVERTPNTGCETGLGWTGDVMGGGAGDDARMDTGEVDESRKGKGQDAWVEVAIDIPGYRDDDAPPVFLGATLTEALVSDGALKDRLYINTRFHWRLCVDILLLSPPTSHPLPLLSLTTHLALLRTRLPALISEEDEDPLFNDDWDASIPLYPSSTSKTSTTTTSPPPITLLVMSVASNIIFDPSREELAVADSVFAVSVAAAASSSSSPGNPRQAKIVAIRAIDPPSRLTNAGTPIQQPAQQTDGASSGAVLSKAEALERSGDEGESGMVGGLWRAPRGGVKRGVLGRIIKDIVGEGGVGVDVLDALESVEG
ncbi:hypothetical protein AAFC00_007131 [Neodothiora populina]|uniref:Ribosomal RNA-processing protein 42 n=1 Tax=Neodothiora populina TaxID=2781224 RepID=A0ABR3PHA3_9PEZI